MTSQNCTQSFLFLALQGENTIQEPYCAPGCLAAPSCSASHGADGTDTLVFLHHTMILITLHQIVCSRRGRRHRPWLCLVSTLLMLVLLKDLDFYSAYISGIQLKDSALLLDVRPRADWLTSLSVSPLLQRFAGNVNSEAVVQNKLSHPVRTRFLRFVPLDWNPSSWMGLRVEVYGCSYSE